MKLPKGKGFSISGVNNGPSIPGGTRSETDREVGVKNQKEGGMWYGVWIVIPSMGLQRTETDIMGKS